MVYHEFSRQSIWINWLSEVLLVDLFHCQFQPSYELLVGLSHEWLTINFFFFKFSEKKEKQKQLNEGDDTNGAAE